MSHLFRKLLKFIPTLYSNNRSSRLISQHILIPNLQRLRVPKTCINHSSEIIARRSIYASQQQDPRLPKIPELVYMPHFMRWIISKVKLQYLKIRWDSEFSEGAFIYGATQAICRVTEIISKETVADLEHLMTVSAKIKLKEDMQYRITKQQKEIVQIKPEDIKILVPLSVVLEQNGQKKSCKIKLRTLALKWLEVGLGNYKLGLIALQTEFLRDYSKNVKPEWTISEFYILECLLLAEAVAEK